jgi:hypothetical protein
MEKTSSKPWEKPPPHQTPMTQCKGTCWLLHYSSSGGPDQHPDNGGGSFAAGRACKSQSLPCCLHNSSLGFDVEEVLSVAIDNDQARSEHCRQGSAPSSHVWTRQLNSQANRTETRRESFLAVQHGGFVNAKTWLEHGGTRPGIME